MHCAAVVVVQPVEVQTNVVVVEVMAVVVLADSVVHVVVVMTGTTETGGWYWNTPDSRPF